MTYVEFSINDEEVLEKLIQLNLIFDRKVMAFLIGMKSERTITNWMLNPSSVREIARRRITELHEEHNAAIQFSLENLRKKTEKYNG